MKQPEKICAIDRKEKQKNYVQEEREYQDSLEYLDFDIDILFFGFYKTIVNSLEKKRGNPLVHGGIHIQPIKQGSKKLNFFIEAIKPLYYRTSQNYTHPRTPHQTYQDRIPSC